MNKDLFTFIEMKLEYALWPLKCKHIRGTALIIKRNNLIKSSLLFNVTIHWLIITLSPLRYKFIAFEGIQMLLAPDTRLTVENIRITAMTSKCLICSVYNIFETGTSVNITSPSTFSSKVIPRQTSEKPHDSHNTPL
jgi:hypothetical protein